MLLVSCGERPLQAPPPNRAVPLPVLSFVERAPVCVAAGSVHQFMLRDEWQRPARGLRIAWSLTPNDGRHEAKMTIAFAFPDRTVHGTYELTRVGPRHDEMGLHSQPSKLVLRGIPFNRARHEPCARELRAESLVP